MLCTPFFSLSTQLDRRDDHEIRTDMSFSISTASWNIRLDVYLLQIHMSGMFKLKVTDINLGISKIIIQHM